jgi:hypothetical protein
MAQVSAGCSQLAAAVTPGPVATARRGNSGAGPGRVLRGWVWQTWLQHSHYTSRGARQPHSDARSATAPPRPQHRCGLFAAWGLPVQLLSSPGGGELLPCRHADHADLGGLHDPQPQHCADARCAAQPCTRRQPVRHSSKWACLLLAVLCCPVPRSSVSPLVIAGCCPLLYAPNALKAAWHLQLLPAQPWRVLVSRHFSHVLY